MEKIIFFHFCSCRNEKKTFFSKYLACICLQLISHPCHLINEKMIGFLKVAQFKATFFLDYDDQYQEMTNEARQPIKIQVSQLKHGCTAFPF